MAKTKKLDSKLQAWADARQRHHLSHAHVQMARELGLNPTKLGGKDNPLGEVLPVGWRERVQRIFEGQVLVLSTLSRPDLLKSKLFALCDRGTDLPDSIALAPTAEELAECVPWLEVQDGNELWPAHVRATLADLARRLGHGV